ncbi:MAG: LysM peptidoglycan-binding domain-containing protein [Deltaproteobacteria bacterium]|nr:LysM peptidoglycan-binding domain-containing protein [Deltaproteobacteria bacterium]
MRLRQNDPILTWMTAMFLATAAWAFTLSAHASRPAENSVKDNSVAETIRAKPEIKPEAKAEAKAKPEPVRYIVVSGDSLTSIARVHGIARKTLMKANNIKNADQVREGLVLVLPGVDKAVPAKPKGVVIEVPKGFSLTRIAAAYKMKVRDIVRANNLKDPSRLRAGARILIPGATEVVELVPCLKPEVTLYRVQNDTTVRASLCTCNGRAYEKGIVALSAMAGPLRGEPPFPLHPRLVELLQRVVDKYPGRRVEVISGQRISQDKSAWSYHTKGQALDFRVQGIPNKTLVGFVRGFDGAGVGFYPNSVFIHMDTREKNAWWIDYSRPGEQAIYGKAGMTAAEIEDIRAKRRRPIVDQLTAEASSDAEQALGNAASALQAAAPVLSPAPVAAEPPAPSPAGIAPSPAPSNAG